MTARKRSRPYFVTTAIPYVNSTPHVGFAMELVQADVLARYQRLVGRPVRFLCGTDENSLKNARAAAEQGISTAELVERNARAFDALGDVLDLSRDDFIRTSTDPRHRPGVEALWNACTASGDIYKGVYEGLYCVGCEQFWRESELAGGVCPEHGVAPEPVKEENYFFRLSRYASVVLEHIDSGRLAIAPAKRANEIRSFLRAGVEDISISRSRARALGWGIPVPEDREQVVYVWFDALANYITALGYPDRTGLFETFWSRGETNHVIGKGITRFHAVYWPAILLSAGLPLPDRIHVHGYVTAGREKIGKTRGNAIDPAALVERFGVDAVRYFLLRHIRTTEDGDFSEALLCRAHDSELADSLGNLLSRTLALIERHRAGAVPAPGTRLESDAALVAAGTELVARVDDAVRGYQLSDALADIGTFVSAANRYIVEHEPWNLARQSSEEAHDRLDTVLYQLTEALRLVATLLGPFLPRAARTIAEQLGLPAQTRPSALRWGNTEPGTPIRRGPALFPKLAT